MERIERCFTGRTNYTSRAISGAITEPCIARVTPVTRITTFALVAARIHVKCRLIG